MPLIKKANIHFNELIRHLGERAGISVEHLAQQISAAEAEAAQNMRTQFVVSEEERQQKINEIMNEARGEADRLKSDIEKEARENAEKQAAEIVAAAQAQANEILERERGKGLEQGRAEAMKQMEAHVQEAVQVIEQAKQQRNAIIRSAVPEILKLSVKTAGEIVRTELHANQDIVMNIVRDAIEKISDNEQVVIKVSQHDLQVVRNKKDLIIDLVEAKNLSIVADKHVDEGGCMIETKLGFIDARIDTKLEMIQNALIAVYEEEKMKKQTVLREKQERGEEVNFERAEQEEIEDLMKEVKPEHWEEKAPEAPSESTETTLLAEVPIANPEPQPATPAPEPSPEGDELDQMISDLK